MDHQHTAEIESKMEDIDLNTDESIADSIELDEERPWSEYNEEWTKTVECLIDIYVKYQTQISIKPINYGFCESLKQFTTYKSIVIKNDDKLIENMRNFLTEWSIYYGIHTVLKRDTYSTCLTDHDDYEEFQILYNNSKEDMILYLDDWDCKRFTINYDFKFYEIDQRDALDIDWFCTDHMYCNHVNIK